MLEYNYKETDTEVADIAPHLLGDKYSNPWYFAVPNKWFSHSERLLIVGQDGFGFDGNRKSDGIKPENIEYLQEKNLDYFQHYVSNPEEHEHDFWTRARSVAMLGIPCAYTFQNMFSMKHDHRSKPSDQDRSIMHSTSIKLLEEEIKIIKPTHIYFFGWYGDALKAELPSVHARLYPYKDDDFSMWVNSYASFEVDGIYYLFSFNPYSPYWKNKPNNYEEMLLDEFKSHITFSKAMEKRAKAHFKPDKQPKERQVKNTEILDNPNTERYAKAQQQVVQNRNINWYNCNQRVCATCKYWDGERQFDKGSQRVNAGSGQMAYCRKHCTRNNTPTRTCNRWERV